MKALTEILSGTLGKSSVFVAMVGLINTAMKNINGQTTYACSRWGSINLERKKERKKERRNENRLYCTKEGITREKLRKKSIIPYLHTYLHKYIVAGMHKTGRRLA